jgi:hypothetical protein
MAVAAATAALVGGLAVATPGAAQAGTPIHGDSPAAHQPTASTVTGTTLQHVAGAADNVYYIKNQHSGKCMTVHGASRANGARVDQYRCISGAHNQWWVVYDMGAPGMLRVTGFQSGKCLSVLGGSARKGAPLVQWACNGAADQLFMHAWPTNHKAVLKSYRSGKCLDVQGGSTSNNAPIIQWSCNGRTNQKWYTTG